MSTDIKQEWKNARSFRSFERAAKDLNAEDLLSEVLHEDVERVAYLEKPTRDAAARRILTAMMAMREARRADGT